MKALFDQRVRCPRGHAEIAATCPICYEIALTQQKRQQAEETKRLHADYLVDRDMLKEAA